MAEIKPEAKKEKTRAPKSHVSKEKIEAVKRMAEAIKKAKTVMLVSIKSLPSSQFQKIKKDLRGKADLYVAKKSVILRALDAAETPELLKLKESVQEDSAVLISNGDAFELAGWFTENKNPIAAKEGQIAENDIAVDEGPTDLVPGPVISELGSLGLQIMVEEGKITIRKSKVAVKKGDKVSAAAASIFQKLGIKPFMIGISPLAFYDGSSKKVYVGVKIDKKKMLEDILIANSKAIGLSVAIAYPTKQNIGLLLAKANAHNNALIKLQTKTQ
jgi:large subunit ribosomal protein L10